MRELNDGESQAISGGLFDFAFLGGFFCGVQEFNFSTTLHYSAAFGAIAGGAVGVAEAGLVGLVVCAPLYAAFETGMSYLGYTIGSYFVKPAVSTMTTTVVVN